MGPQIAQQTLATKRNVTNKNRMLFCQHKMRHRARRRRSPLEQSFRAAIKVQAPTTKLQKNIKPQSVVCFGVWNLEFPWMLGLGGSELV